MYMHAHAHRTHMHVQAHSHVDSVGQQWLLVCVKRTQLWHREWVTGFWQSYITMNWCSRWDLWPGPAVSHAAGYQCQQDSSVHF